MSYLSLFLTDEYDKSVEVEVTLALALRLVIGPDDGQHPQRLGHEDDGAGGFVDAILVEVVKLLLQQDLGVVLAVVLAVVEAAAVISVTVVVVAQVVFLS